MTRVLGLRYAHNTDNEPVCNAGWDNVTNTDDSSTMAGCGDEINTKRTTKGSVNLDEQWTSCILYGFYMRNNQSTDNYSDSCIIHRL